MPVKPLRDDLKLGNVYETSLDELFDREELEAREVFRRSLQFDPLCHSEAWERLVARMTTGEVT